MSINFLILSTQTFSSRAIHWHSINIYAEHISGKNPRGHHLQLQFSTSRLHYSCRALVNCKNFDFFGLQQMLQWFDNQKNGFKLSTRWALLTLVGVTTAVRDMGTQRDCIASVSVWAGSPRPEWEPATIMRGISITRGLQRPIGGDCQINEMLNKLKSMRRTTNWRRRCPVSKILEF